MSIAGKANTNNRIYIDTSSIEAIKSSLSNQKLRDESKLRAKLTGEGWKVYVEKGKDSVLERLTGAGARKRLQAKQVLQNAMLNLMQDSHPSDIKVVIDLFAAKVFKSEVQQVQLIAEVALHRSQAPKIERQKLSDALRPDMKFSADKENGVTLTFGGKTYIPDARQAGIEEGGYGEVNFFVNKDNPEDRVVVKTLKKPPETGYDFDAVDTRAHLTRLERNFLHEVEMHRTAQGSSGHKNIAHFHGACRTVSGELAMVLEAAPHGSVDDLGARLVDLVQRKIITPDDAAAVRLTMLKDMAEGLDESTKNKIVDCDFKGPNVLIGSNGEAKIIDFGAAQGDGKFIVAEGVIDNQRWSSPEYAVARNKIQQNWENFETVNGIEEAKAKVGKFRHGKYNNTYKNIVNVLIKENIVDKNKEILVNKKSDIWSLGVTSLNLLIGKDYMDDATTNTEVCERLEKFAASNDDEDLGAATYFFPSSQTEAMRGSTAKQEITLIRWMMEANPTRRPNLDKVLRSEVLKDKRVGSPEVRALIVAIGSGADDATISAAAGKIEQPKAPSNTPLNLPSGQWRYVAPPEDLPQDKLLS